MKVRRKQIVEAYQYTGDPNNPGWPPGWLEKFKFSDTGDRVFVLTHKGEVWVAKDGWIVQDGHGHTHFCREQVFKEMYEDIETAAGPRMESMFGTQLEAAAKTVHDLFYAYCTKTFVTGLRRPEGEDPMLDRVVDALNQLHVMLTREKATPVQSSTLPLMTKDTLLKDFEKKAQEPEMHQFLEQHPDSSSQENQDDRRTDR